MFLDPDKLNDADPAGMLAEAAHARLGLDHRFLHALIDRPAESLPAVVAFAARPGRGDDRVDLSLDLIALFRYWRAPEGVPFLIDFIKEDPEDVPDDVVYALAENAPLALEPLLKLYGELEESESGEVAFLLANLELRDERILKLLSERLEYDLSDTMLLLDMYGDPAAVPAMEKAAESLTDADKEFKQEVASAIANLKQTEPPEAHEPEPFDIFEMYPERAEPPVDLLDDDEREEWLAHPVAAMRAAATHSFFNQSLSPELRKKLLALAQKDESDEVRARAWESLIDAAEEPEIAEAMLTALRDPNLTVTERGGLVVGLAPEADRNEVRRAITDLYAMPEGRAKALEAMWRSIHPGFRDYFAPHLDDEDLEVRRAALWGVGYYGLKSELDKVRHLFDDEDLRNDALFSYALALPTEVSRGRMKGLLQRIDKDAHGLSELEEELVKAALDERLLLAGKEPVFRQQED